MLIDTHAHLNFKDYNNEIDSIIKKSIALGVEKIICVSSNIADSIEAIELAKKYSENIFASIGVHPQCTDPENKDSVEIQLGNLEKLILENKNYIVAIGEFGFDFVDVADGERKRELAEQEKLFWGQIDLARKYDLPISLHLNKAHDYFLENCQKLKNMRGIFHCYAGGKKRLKKFLEFENFMFGVNGLVTYDEGLTLTIKDIPIERIVLETDCPYLAPLPHRGERNDPSYIPLIAEKIAEIKEVSSQEIANYSTENVKKVFHDLKY